MSVRVHRLFSLSLLLPILALAESPFDISSNMKIYSQYGSFNNRNDSLLNPGNAIAQLPTRQFSLEARAQIQAKSEYLNFMLRGIEIKPYTDKANNTNAEGYLSQAYASVQLGSRINVRAGRLLLTWGPGQFRSPSNPFYFDAGKAQPLRELTGIDAASMLYSGKNTTVRVAHIFNSGHTGGIQGEKFKGNQLGSTNFGGTNLLKIDVQGRSWQNSLVLAKKNVAPLYAGAYGEWIASDALSLYAEAGSGNRPQLLLPDSYRIVVPSPRASTALLGSSYTLENGQTIYSEFLYDGHGYNRNDERAYFEFARQASTKLALTNASIMRLGQALNAAPVMLGRRYISAFWQSSPQDSRLFWQGTWAINADDRSQQIGVYVEKNVLHRVTLFGSINLNIGGRDTEFGALLKRSVFFGVKIFVL